MPKYKKNFLTDVMFKVDFNPILSISSEEPAKYQEAIRELFPRFAKLNGVAVSIDGSQPTKELNRKWQFINVDKTQIVDLDQSSVALTVKKYVGFEDFFSKINIIYKAFESEYKPTIINRVGLRYINQITLDGNPFEWDGILNQRLYSPLSVFPDHKNNTMRNMSVVELNINDHRVVVNYGLYNSQYPNAVSQKEFVLDFDSIYAEECDSADVLKIAESFHGEIIELFESSIEDGLRDIMEVDDVG